MAEFACAECGTTTATTFVVTTLNPENPRRTRTEVCRECDRALAVTQELEQWFARYKDLCKWRDEEIEAREESEEDRGYSYAHYDEAMADINEGLASLADEAAELLRGKEGA